MPDTEWQARVKGLLKAELKRRNVTYRDLASRLEAMGIHETERNLNNKISRGGFSAVFLIQCLAAAVYWSTFACAEFYRKLTSHALYLYWQRTSGPAAGSFCW